MEEWARRRTSKLLYVVLCKGEKVLAENLENKKGVFVVVVVVCGGLQCLHVKMKTKRESNYGIRLYLD